MIISTYTLHSLTIFEFPIIHFDGLLAVLDLLKLKLSDNLRHMM